MARLGRNTEKPDRVLFVGRIVPSKGIEIAMEAVSLSQERLGRPITLRVVGWGKAEYIQELRSCAARLGISNQAEFVGPVSFGPSLLSEYDRADLFVMPSLYSEGTPRALSEALAVGLPSLASNQSGMADVFGPGLADMLFEPGNALQLADKLCQILGDVQEYRDAVTRASARGECLDVESVAAAIAKMLKED
jgi:glycosyltransferase involved in cell wall biosynthesis